MSLIRASTTARSIAMRRPGPPVPCRLPSPTGRPPPLWRADTSCSLRLSGLSDYDMSLRLFHRGSRGPRPSCFLSFLSAFPCICEASRDFLLVCSSRFLFLAAWSSNYCPIFRLKYSPWLVLLIFNFPGKPSLLRSMDDWIGYLFPFLLFCPLLDLMSFLLYPSLYLSFLFGPLNLSLFFLLVPFYIRVSIFLCRSSFCNLFSLFFPPLYSLIF